MLVVRLSAVTPSSCQHLRFPDGFQHSQRPTLLDSHTLIIAGLKSEGTAAETQIYCKETRTLKSFVRFLALFEKPKFAELMD